MILLANVTPIHLIKIIKNKGKKEKKRPGRHGEQCHPPRVRSEGKLWRRPRGTGLQVGEWEWSFDWGVPVCTGK